MAHSKVDSSCFSACVGCLPEYAGSANVAPVAKKTCTGMAKSSLMKSKKNYGIIIVQKRILGGTKSQTLLGTLEL